MEHEMEIKELKFKIQKLTNEADILTNTND